MTAHDYAQRLIWEFRGEHVEPVYIFHAGIQTQIGVKPYGGREWPWGGTHVRHYIVSGAWSSKLGELIDDERKKARSVTTGLNYSNPKD